VKCILNFVTAHYCSLQSSPLPSLCSRSRVLPLLEAPFKTDFMVSCIGSSAIVPEFQVHPENNNLKCAISFWEIRINHKE
jgi:hypothetical protein